MTVGAAEDYAHRAVAIVGVGAVMPDAVDAGAFWANITGGRYSITDVPDGRWDPALYYDADPYAPEKTYSKIGGWVREFDWNPLGWKLPIPPLVSAAMDEGQKWAVACTRAALIDAGWPERSFDHERTAVIFGNALAGEKHYLTALRISFPEFAQSLEQSPSFAALPADIRAALIAESHDRMMAATPPITEDTMPGELGNVLAGRIANIFDFRGPNFVTDAACASALAAITAGVDGLLSHEFDTVVTGGIDRNMNAAAFVKFCKIGALSATGTRPYADGADGFVMGEGAAVFVLKRLADAEAAGDRVYAVLRGIAGSSDGKGKGITAPNPVGQRLAVERAWRQAGLSPASATLVEGHGTSTRVGDVAEVDALMSVFGAAGAAQGSIALGSVKSNIGHLKAAAGAAGLFKAALALHHKVLPPSLNFAAPNPNIDFAAGPFRVNTELREWPTPPSGVRAAGVSAFGFGGTNFHVVLEEYVPGRLRAGTTRTFAASAPAPAAVSAAADPGPAKAPLRGLVVLGAADEASLADRLGRVADAAGRGDAPSPAAPAAADLAAPVRIALDFADAAELADKAGKAKAALAAGQPAIWRALRSRGVFLGRGAAPKTAFLFTGQGSQYVNMLKQLRATEPIVAATFAEADRVMTPLLGRPLTDFIFIDAEDPAAVKQLEQQLLQTEITQPAVLATDIALYRLLQAYGVEPDMVMGHSLGEYAALVAAGSLTFASALEAVSARGHEMATLSIGDNGAMAAVFGPLAEIERIVDGAEGYVVVANVNSTSQAVIGGATAAVEGVMGAFAEAGFTAVRIPVSHAFHTSIVAPASEPLKVALARMELRAPVRPIVANVNGAFYPTGPGADEQMLDILGRQVAEPVQFVRGLETLYDAGARMFIEVGPKRALHGFAEDVLGATHDDAQALFANHPKAGDVPSFNQALAGLYAAGLGAAAPATPTPAPIAAPAPVPAAAPSAPPTTSTTSTTSTPARSGAAMTTDRYVELGHLFADFLEHGREIMEGTAPASSGGSGTGPMEPVAITGAALGLPGTERVFDDHNVARLLGGEQLIDLIPTRFRHKILDKHITRLVKGDGGGRFESIDDPADVLKLAGRAGHLDLVEEFGVDPERDRALDTVTRLAIGAGFDALRDAGIPLVQHYRLTSLGTQLPSRWGLPDSMRDDTGVIFASAFPGFDAFADELERHYTDQGRRHELEGLRSLRARVTDAEPVAAELDHRTRELEALLAEEGYEFDRRFLFRVLSMGHSQFAEIIGARGPNTQVNSACASTTQAIALAEDWIRAGRCRRVVIVAGDDVTADHLVDWVGAGFLASGAAATDDVVENAALPFDNRRHGMIMGMGAAGLVVESADAARERGIQPICEVLSSVTANSAFHGTRLDVEHIGQLMESLVAQAEARGIRRHEFAPETVFVSHETYTPARGGSAAAEINALRQVFGADADRIVIANTKGFTGHPMGVGIEDVVAVKALETGLVPPIPNFRDIDPELGQLNLSTGGAYPVRFALRLAAGFGSQISMTLLRWTPVPDGAHREPTALGHGYRVVDPAAWGAWLRGLSGQDDPQLEVVQRRLRVVDRGWSAPRTAPAAPAVPVAVPAASPVVPAVPVVPAIPLPPAAVPAAPAAVAAVAPAGVDPVVAEVLSVVSEKTGYPQEMLDLDLDLEADLGVDTVKQAEVFAAIRETFAIERDDSLQLRDYPTLTHVVGFVRDRGTNLPAAAPAAAPAPAAPAAPAGVDPVVAEVLSVVSEKTGYPQEMLDLDLDLEADLGVDTVKQAEVFAAIRETFAIERDDSLQLRDYPTLTHVVGFVRDRGTNLPAAAPAAAPAPAAPAAVAAVAPAGVDPVVAEVLSVVSEKTGYPQEMLDLDLDLEADLGVDTVKQAEVFAAIRETFAIERDDSLQLRDYPTLTHVVGFVRDRGTNLPAAAPAAAPAPAAPAAPAGVDPVVAEVLSVVSEKTGYPQEMLDLDLDLEADLGVDTVKQAEVFAAIRETFAIERDDSLQLRDYPTLTHVVGFVRDRATTLPAGGSDAAEPSPAAALPEVPVLSGSLEAAEQIPRRVPVPVLRPALDRCRPTGVRLDETARVVVMADQGGVGDALASQLGKLGVAVLAVTDAPDAETLGQRLADFSADGPVTGVYWLPALDAEGPVAELDLDAWREALRIRVGLLYTTMRAVAEGSPFLVAATRMGGQHGYDPAGAVNPLGGAVTGFAKAYAREAADALVKAVDLAPSRKTAALAELLIGETLRDPGCVEVGYADEERWTIGLEERPADDGRPGLTLDGSTVYVVSGAAGSIVSAIVADLAKAGGGGVFHLLDLTPEPDPSDPDLVRYATDREGLKQDLIARHKAAGEKVTPVAVERELASLERRSAALAALEAVAAAGGQAIYHSVDLGDVAAVGAVLGEALQHSGRVDVLVHAAGIEISRRLANKEPDEFSRVFAVKSDGWFALMSALRGRPLGAVVAFSSVAGRFGNLGQTDYAAGNDLLCKLASNLRTSQPDTRGIAIDWTAWGGIGMATRGSIPVMMEAAGIDMLPPEAGIATVRRELISGGTSDEIVVAQRLGIMTAEYAEAGGLDVAAIDVSAAGPMIGQVVEMGVHSGLVVETTLDPTAQPFLDHHRISGTPVLPGVMGMEAFAEVARLAFPDRHVVAIEDVDFLRPLKFYRDEPRTLRISATFVRDGDDVVGRCRLDASRTLPGRDEPEVTTHFTGRVRLAGAPPAEATGQVPGDPSGPSVGQGPVYEVLFHGPAYQVVDDVWRDGSAILGRYAEGLVPGHHPDSQPTVTDPRLVELCFQTAAVAALAEHGLLALPAHVDRVVVLGHPAEPAGRLAAVTAEGAGGGVDAEVLDGEGRVFVRLEGYRTIELPQAVDEALLAPLRAVASAG